MDPRRIQTPPPVRQLHPRRPQRAVLRARTNNHRRPRPHHSHQDAILPNIQHATPLDRHRTPMEHPHPPPTSPHHRRLGHRPRPRYLPRRGLNLLRPLPLPFDAMHPAPPPRQRNPRQPRPLLLRHRHRPHPNPRPLHQHRHCPRLHGPALHAPPRRPLRLWRQLGLQQKGPATLLILPAPETARHLARFRQRRRSSRLCSTRSPHLPRPRPAANLPARSVGSQKPSS